MNRRFFLRYLQALIILAPLPFGGIGRVVTPLVFIAVMIAALFALQQPREGEEPVGWKWLKRAFMALFLFTLFQVVPLPWFLLKIVSPATADVIVSLLPAGTAVPAFHSISLVPAETLFQLLRWSAWGLFFYSLVHAWFSMRELIQLMHAMIGAAFLQLGIAMIKYMGGNRFFFIFFHPVRNPNADRFLTGTIANSDHFAFFLELIFPVVLALFLAEFLFYQKGETLAKKILFLVDEKRKVLLYLAAAAALGAGIILTGSRAGIISFLVATFVFIQLSIFVRLPTSTRRKLRYVMTAVAILVVMIGFQETLGKFLAMNPAQEGRLVYWSNALRLLKQFPVFGCGFGTFKFAYFLRDPFQRNWLTHAHNEYVESLAEGGLLGSLLLFFVGGVLIFFMFRAWMVRRRPDVKALGLGVLIAFLTAILHLAFEFALRVPANVVLVVFLAALGLKIVGYQQRTTLR